MASLMGAGGTSPPLYLLSRFLLLTGFHQSRRMDILGQVLAAASITGSLGAAVGLPPTLGSPVDSTADNGPLEDLDGNGNESGDSAVSLAERHESAPAEAGSIAEELGFDLSESASPRFSRNITLVKGQGRRRKRFKGRGRVMQQNPLDDPLASVVYPQHHRVSRSVVGRRSANSSGNNSKGASLRTALMGALIICAVVWVARQISTYRRAAANLSVLQKDYQQLLNQVERSRGTPDKVEKQNRPAEEKRGETVGVGFLDPGVGNRDAEAHEDAWNVDLVAELLATQSRVAELERMREELGKRPPAEAENAERPEEAPKAVDLPPLTPEEALQETAKLEGELQSLKQQCADLEVIIELREEIQREQTLLDKSSVAAVSMGNRLGGMNILYRELNALQEAFSRLGDSEMLAQVEQQKAKLREVLESAKKSCAWAPGLTELSLLVEKDRLQTETANARAKIEEYHKRKDGGIPVISTVKNIAVSSLRTSGQLIWKAVSWFRGGQNIDMEDSLDARQRVERDRAQRENQRLQEEQTLAELKKELADEEASHFAEQQVLDKIHSYEAKQFLDWLKQKNAEASSATNFVLATLRSLPRSLPSNGQTMTDAQMAYSAALESSTSKALNALEHVEQ